VSKILIVDDDPDIVEAGRLVLEKEGYEVEGGSSYADGMTQIEAFKPDLLILDVMMEEPDDGLRFAREMRRKGHSIPILMLTSVNAAMGLSIGKDDEIVPVEEFQEKPVDPANLVDKVKRLLQK
jgi:DNA-binding response OmpR family regulator